MDQRIVSFRAALDTRPVTGFQIRMVAIAVLLLLTEGFDSQAIGYVAPALRELLHLTPLQMGSALSVGLFGLTIGALVFAPLADRFKTRGLLVICILICGISTIATIWVSSLQMLIACRFLTGFGVGGVMPQAIGVVSEYAPTRWRTTIVTIAGAGFSLGGVVGGTVSATLIPRYGWQAVLIFGGVAALLMLPFALWSFPNSLPQLLNSAEPRAELAKVVALLAPGWKEPKVPAGSVKEHFPVRLLFEGGYTTRTLLIWTAYFMNILALYFILNWLPSVLKTGRAIHRALQPDHQPVQRGRHRGRSTVRLHERQNQAAMDPRDRLRWKRAVPPQPRLGGHQCSAANQPAPSARASAPSADRIR